MHLELSAVLFEFRQHQLMSGVDVGQITNSSALWLKEYYGYYGRFEGHEADRIVTHRFVDSLLPTDHLALA